MSITWRSTRSRPSSPSTRAGLLLVEAALATVVIAVGLVFISRAFSSALRTLQTARLHDTALLLAQQKLDELGVDLQRAPAVPTAPGAPAAPLTSVKEGTFEAPHAAFGWIISAKPNALDPAVLAGRPQQPLTAWVVIEVKTAAPAMPVRVSLTTLMPHGRIPPGWFLR